MINKSKPKKDVCQIDVNGTVVTDANAIADRFNNNYYFNVGADLAKNIPVCSKEAINFIPKNMEKSLFFVPTTKREISDIIVNLKQTDSVGHDSIPLKLVRHCKSELAEILSDINNHAIAEGVFPDSLKIAKVIPIFKAGDLKSVTNYRPISILPIFSKIFEKVIYKRLDDFLTKNEILHKNQFGFRAKLSTCTALLVDKITGSIDRKKQVVFFIDLAKAFDIVDHKILVQKLESYCIRGVALNYFRNYLSKPPTICNNKWYIFI